MELNIYRTAKLIREFENLLLDLFSKGKINGTVHTCVGQEIIPSVLKDFLIKDDVLFSNHRGHGHYIAATDSIDDLLAEIMGRVSGCSGGYGGSQHLYKENRFYSNGIQGGMAPISVGYSLAKKIQKISGIAIQFIGDGTLGEGLLYESLNCASVYEAPILFILENNRYAQSTSIIQTFRGDLENRIKGFGLNYYNSNIWELDDLKQKLSSAIKNARDFKPTFIEIECYRLNSHSKGDDNRDSLEIDSFREIDPINLFEKQNPDLIKNISEEIKNRLNEALEKAENSPVLINSKVDSFISENESEFNLLTDTNSKRVNEQIYDGLKLFFEKNPSSLMLGEDIEYKSEFTSKGYGGAFKVTNDLSSIFPNVHNSPISESAIVGISIGAALGGTTSIVEIMFGDFMTLTLDQIYQHASKFLRMYGKDLRLPVVIRTPMGGGRGYGPTHSQSIEKFFLGIPGIHVVAINYRIDVTKFYQNLLFGINTPHLIIENKIDYTKRGDSIKINTHEYFVTDSLYPTLFIKPKHFEPKLTILCYGGVLSSVEDAAMDLFIKDEIPVEIICFSLISTIDYPTLQKSCKKTNKILIVEEGPSYAAFGSELISTLVERNNYLKKVVRIGNNSVIPSSYSAEINLLPTSENIRSTIKKIINHDQ